MTAQNIELTHNATMKELAQNLFDPETVSRELQGLENDLIENQEKARAEGDLKHGDGRLTFDQ